MRNAVYSAGVGPQILTDHEIEVLVEHIERNSVDLLVAGLFCSGNPREAYAVIGEVEREQGKKEIASGDASDLDGKRAIAWLKGEVVEVRRTPAVEAARRPMPAHVEPPKAEAVTPLAPMPRTLPRPRRIMPIPGLKPAPVTTPVDAPEPRTPSLPMRPRRPAPAKVDPPADVVVHTPDAYAVALKGPLLRLPSDADWEWIETTTSGATKESAGDLLAIIRAQGICVEKAGRLDRNWDLWTSEICLLGLAEPVTPAYGLAGVSRANSIWWSRNWQYEEARCAPPL